MLDFNGSSGFSERRKRAIPHYRIGKLVRFTGEFVGTQRRFSDLLIARGIEKWRNGMGVRGFQGVGLKAEPKAERMPYTDK